MTWTRLLINELDVRLRTSSLTALLLETFALWS